MSRRSSPPPSYGGGREGEGHKDGLEDFRSEICATTTEAFPLPTLPRKTGEEKIGKIKRLGRAAHLLAHLVDPRGDQVLERRRQRFGAVGGARPCALRRLGHAARLAALIGQDQ